MKTTISVTDRREADAIRSGLEDPATRAFVGIVGILLRLPSDRARARVLAFVADHFEEQRNAHTERNHNGEARIDAPETT